MKMNIIYLEMQLGFPTEGTSVKEETFVCTPSSDRKYISMSPCAEYAI